MAPHVVAGLLPPLTPPARASRFRNLVARSSSCAVDFKSRCFLISMKRGLVRAAISRASFTRSLITAYSETGRCQFAMVHRGS